jgi:glycosyltransferase EpsH
MMHNQLLSVIVPIYNGEKYLNECIESIVNQTYKNLEILCINDGSTDRSLEILQKWQNRDNRIKVYSQDNSGVATARNVGIREARGEFVSFVDCDDMIACNAIELLYKYGEMFDISIGKATHDIMNIPSDVSRLEVEPYKLKLIILNYKKYNGKFLDKNFSFEDQWGAAISCGRLYRREMLVANNILYPKSVVLGEDVVFNLMAYTYAQKCVLIDKPIYYYRPNELSVTSNFQPRRYANTLLLAKEVFNLIDIGDKEQLGAAQQFIYGRIVHCYMGYFCYLKDKEQRKREEKKLLKDSIINKSIYNAKIRYCAYGKSVIPLMLYIKAKGRIYFYDR